MARRGKGEGSIYQRASDGLWCVTIEVPNATGERPRKTLTSKSKAKVIEKLRNLQAQIREYGTVQTATDNLADWMTYYLDDIMPSRVRPNVLSDYKRYNEKWITPVLGRKKLDKITPDDVHRLVRMVEKAPKDPKLQGLKPSELPPGYAKYSKSYVRSMFNVLSGALAEAVSRRRIFRNPCNDTDRPKIKKTVERALEPAEAMKLLNHLNGLPDAEAALWATYLLSGARRGEVIGLEIDRALKSTMDFSWQLQDVPHITEVPADWEHRHVRGNLYLTRPKTASGWRTVPMIPVLEALINLAIGDRTEGFVFLHPTTGNPWRPDTAYKAWKRLLRDAGLPEDVKLHGTRHTFIDLLFEANVPESLIMDIVGHSTRAMSRAYRTRESDSLKREALTRVGNLLELN